MRAILCKELGPADKLVIEDVPSPQVSGDGVKVKVKAAGLNFPDTLIIEGKYQIKPELPFSPGGEMAGEIIEVGPDVKNLKPGMRVMGLTGYGSFAEEMVISGGVGLAAVELGKAMGAKVIAAASSDDKLQVAKEAGADDLINYTDEDLKEALKSRYPQGIDVIYDPVGDRFTEPALRNMAWNGRFLIVGFAAGEIPKIPANLTLLKGCSVVGVFWGAFTAREPERNAANIAELFQLWQDGKIAPLISETYPLDNAHEAIAKLESRSAIGKLVVTM